MRCVITASVRGRFLIGRCSEKNYQILNLDDLHTGHIVYMTHIQTMYCQGLYIKAFLLCAQTMMWYNENQYRSSSGKAERKNLRRKRMPDRHRLISGNVEQWISYIWAVGGRVEVRSDFKWQQFCSCISGCCQRTSNGSRDHAAWEVWRRSPKFSDSSVAETLLKNNQADLIGVGRVILKDSLWAQRAMSDLQKM